jgi:hypothetical protein
VASEAAMVRVILVVVAHKMAWEYFELVFEQQIDSKAPGILIFMSYISEMRLSRKPFSSNNKSPLPFNIF